MNCRIKMEIYRLFWFFCILPMSIYFLSSCREPTKKEILESLPTVFAPPIKPKNIPEEAVWVPQYYKKKFINAPVNGRWYYCQPIQNEKDSYCCSIFSCNGSILFFNGRVSLFDDDIQYNSRKQLPYDRWTENGILLEDGRLMAMNGRYVTSLPADKADLSCENLGKEMPSDSQEKPSTDDDPHLPTDDGQGE